ncbi:MAG: hypothetical protein C5B50_22760 [Verrucomicrobia bacterium]|nr:MAG: hypothetical protein C5B50_22760 [Verrucomicrobiota bacterium]
MDWSLVLASQGIECVIEHSPEPPSWRLTVAGSDSQRAIATIRQYHSENRGWDWRRHVFRPDLEFDWASLAWPLLLFVFFWVNENRVDLQSSGAMDSVAVARGQWWRLFTAIWLHADAAHLAANATLGVILLGLAMGAYGTGPGMFATYLAGAVGNVVAGIFSAQPHHSLGASGMVMGALGLLVVQGLPLLRPSSSSSSSSSSSTPPPSRPQSSSQSSQANVSGVPSKGRLPPRSVKLVLPTIMAGVLLFILLGLSPDPRTDLVAHAGGFMSGIVLGPVFRLLDHFKQKKAMDAICGLLSALLVILPWWLALTSAKRL